MSRTTLLLVCVLLASALAGCHDPEGAGNNTGDGDGDGGDGGGGDGNDTASHAEAVRVTSAPSEAVMAGSEVEICWQVDGEGTIPHTAVHWDNESHAEEEATFSSYDMGARYPDGSATQDTNGYTVPGEFCTTFTMPEGTIYLVAHAFGAGEAPGVLSEEQTLSVG